MYSVELKIKRKQLASEARDIRTEERKAKANRGGSSSEFRSLQNHRKGPVRREARYSHLAHAFLRDREYRSVERSCRRAGTPSASSYLARLIGSFGRTESARAFGRHGERCEPLVHEFRKLSGSLEKSRPLVQAIELWLGGTRKPSDCLKECSKEQVAAA